MLGLTSLTASNDRSSISDSVRRAISNVASVPVADVDATGEAVSPDSVPLPEPLGLPLPLPSFSSSS